MITINSLVFESTTTTLYIACFGRELWIERNPPHSDDRPFWEAWTVEGAQHWRIGRWQGLLERVASSQVTVVA